MITISAINVPRATAQQAPGCPSDYPRVAIDGEYYNRYWPHADRPAADGRAEGLEENECAIQLPLGNLAQLVDRMVTERLGAAYLEVRLVDQKLADFFDPGSTLGCYHSDNTVTDACCYFQNPDGSCAAQHPDCETRARCELKSSTGEVYGYADCNIPDGSGGWRINASCCEQVSVHPDGSWYCDNLDPLCTATCPGVAVLIRAYFEPTRYRVLHGSWSLDFNNRTSSTDDEIIFDVPIRLVEYATTSSDQIDRWVFRIRATFVDRTRDELENPAQYPTLSPLPSLNIEAPLPAGPELTDYTCRAAGWVPSAGQCYIDLCTEAVNEGTNPVELCGWGSRPPIECWDEQDPHRLRPIDWLNLNQPCEPGEPRIWGPDLCSRHQNLEPFPGLVITWIDGLMADPEAPLVVNHSTLVSAYTRSVAPGNVLAKIPPNARNAIRRSLDQSELQAEIRTQVGSVLDANYVIGETSFSLADLMRNSGGARVTDHALNLLMPCVIYDRVDRAQCTHASTEGCTDRKVICENSLPGDPICSYLDLNHIGTLLDWPKLLHEALQNQRREYQYAIQHGPPQVVAESQQSSIVLETLDPRVVCNQRAMTETPACGSSGDRDGDGFCDNVDFCPDTFTGLNCDLDGDGQGDGFFAAGECQALKHTTLRDILGGKDPVVKEKLARVMCGACDGCTGVDDRMHGADQDGDGLLDYQGPKMDTNTPVVCDHDIDGDGVANELDCDPTNPMVRFDLDQDGRCDDGYEDVPGTSEDPYGQCQHVCSFHHAPGSSGLSLCYRRCRRDTCTWITQAERLCPFGPATRQPECANAVLPTTECPDAWRTLLGGLDPACRFSVTEDDPPSCPHAWRTRRLFCTAPISDPFCGPWASCVLHGVECENVDLGLCHAIHGNPPVTINSAQPDYDGDAIGDKCDWVNAGTPGFSSDPGGLVLTEPTETDDDVAQSSVAFYQRGERYRIRFQAWGGTPALDTSQTPPVPSFGSEPRTNTQVGACYCDQNLYGEWMDQCYSRCPRRQDARLGELITAWNPISSSVCRALPISGSPGDQATYNQYQLCYNRTLEFTRDGSSNFQELYWDWKHMRELGDLGAVVGASYAKSAAAPWERTTRIRVAWPMYGEPIMLTDDTPPYNNEAAFTRNQGLALIDPSELRPLPQIPSGRIPRHFPVMAGGWIGPRPPALSGYALVADLATGSAALLTLGADSPVATSVRPLVMDGSIDLAASFAGAGGLVSAELIGGSPGTVNGVFLYQGPSSPARLLVGEDDPSREDIQLSSSEALWASPPPEAHDPLLVYVVDAQELLLLGSPASGGARDHVWRHRLETGEWEGPMTPPELQGRRGFTADYDPVTRKAVIFGGTSPGGGGPTTGGDVSESTASADVLLLDVEHLLVTVPAMAADPPAGLARTRHGSRLLPDRRALYVAGGEREGQPLTDAWRLDLLAARWELLPGQGPATTEPYVHFDQASKTLWLGDLTDAEPLSGLPLHALSSSGLWYETRALRLDRAGAYPIFDLLVGGRSRSYAWSPEPGTSLPGSYLLARLDSAEGGLSVSLRELGDDEANPGLLDLTGEQRAAILCQSGGRCLAQVAPAPQATAAGHVPFRIDLQEAVPELDLRSSPQGWMDDLVIHQGSLVVAGPWGLRVLDSGTLGQMGHLGGWLLNGASSLEPCGPHLCVSRTGFEGLVIVSLSNPASPQVLGRAFTLGLGWDVAAWGSRAYVAHGVLGVGVYDISDPRNPRLLGSLSAGGVTISVATRGSLLAVGKVGGEVHIYELQGGPTQVSAFSAKGPLQRLRFRGARLWALRNPGKMAEIFDLSRPEAPARLGQIAQDPREEFFARYLGPWRFTLDGNRVSRYRLVPLAR